MAVTVTRRGQTYVGATRRTWGTLALDSNYPPVYIVDANRFELSSLDELNIQPHLGYTFVTESIQTYVGIAVYWGDWNAVANGVLTPVANGTNLSGVTNVPWEAYGV
jgi:hypothetical protein